MFLYVIKFKIKKQWIWVTFRLVKYFTALRLYPHKRWEYVKEMICWVKQSEDECENCNNNNPWCDWLLAINNKSISIMSQLTRGASCFASCIWWRWVHELWMRWSYLPSSYGAETRQQEVSRWWSEQCNQPPVSVRYLQPALKTLLCSAPRVRPPQSLLRMFLDGGQTRSTYQSKRPCP